MKWIGIALAALLAAFIGYGIYGQMTKSTAKSKRLPCQEGVTCFERSYAASEQLREAVALMKEGAYDITVSTQPSVYMESHLFESVDPADVESMITEAIERRISEPDGVASAVKKPLLIGCLIYENDKKDPGKKSKKAFLYEGYLLFTLSVEGKPLYKFQIDFMEPEGADIPQRIDCAVQSIMTYNKEH